MQREEFVDLMRGLVAPAVSELPNEPVALSHGYHVEKGHLPERPQHVFADWHSAAAWSIRQWGSEFDVFVGRESVYFVQTCHPPGEDYPVPRGHRHPFAMVPYEWTDESEVWLEATGGGERGNVPRRHTQRSLHELLNRAGSLVDPQVEQALRAYAHTRTVRTAQDAEQAMSETGAKVVIKGSRGEEVPIDVPREFVVHLGISSPQIWGGARSLPGMTVRVFQWVTPDGIEFSRYEDVVRLRQALCRVLVDDLFPDPEKRPLILLGEPRFVRG
jgi:hypothetical protein